MSNRFQILVACASAACALVMFSALALAQGTPNVECRKTETQAECHARLKCKADEDVVACQMRLLRCSADETLEECKARVGSGRSNQGTGGQRGDNRRDDREDEQTGRERADRGRSERGGRDSYYEGQDTGDRDSGDTRRRRGDARAGGRDRRGGGGGGGSFEANKTFGLGLELGEPTGLNGKVFVSPSVALDFGLGYVYRHYYYGDGLHLYGDVLFHPVSLASSEALELPLYIGGGVRFWDFDYCHMGVCTYGGSAVGIRIPVGISFDFNRVPLDLFLQLVPVIDFVRGDYYDRYRDRSHFGIDFSAGLRFWFK